jgi:hypothetical protein
MFFGMTLLLLSDLFATISFCEGICILLSNHTNFDLTFQPTEVAKRQLFLEQSAAQPAQQMLGQVAEQDSSQVWEIPTRV